MKKLTVSEDSNSDRLKLFFHLIPIIGFFPSLWTLYRHERAGSREQGAGSREERAKGDKGDIEEISSLTTHYYPANVGEERSSNGEETSPSACFASPPPASLLTTHSQKEKLAVSRLSVTLALSWLLAYFLLGAGAENSDFLNFRLLMLNSLLTSGYFLVSLWLMLRLTTSKSVRLPGFSALADRVLGAPRLHSSLALPQAGTVEDRTVKDIADQKTEG